jgi:hypothetical protein
VSSGYGAPSPGPLFDRVRPISRASDPKTSHESEAKLRSSGGLNSQCAETLAALKAFMKANGYAPTTSELAGGDAALVRIYSKRLPDLREAGCVKNPRTAMCSVTKSRCMVWEVVS